MFNFLLLAVIAINISFAYILNTKQDKRNNNKEKHQRLQSFEKQFLFDGSFVNSTAIYYVDIPCSTFPITIVLYSSVIVITLTVCKYNLIW